jgi:ATP-dependent exoDNAse (exonuclease V) alpha subunit
LNTAKEGVGKAQTPTGLSNAAALIDKTAETKLGFTLNAEQRRAGAAIIASPDRYVAIQGGAGTGKSTIFSAVEAVDSSIRGPIFAFTPQNRLASDLRDETGIDTRSLASFLTKFENLADTRARPNIAAAQPYRGATLILDEASMVSNRQMLGFMQIAEKLEVNRIVMIGDSGQISAVEAGSPFRQMQEGALQTIHLDKNLRQRDGEMKEAVALLQAGYVEDAFGKLGNRVVESANPVKSAAQAWLSLDEKARAQTAIFTSGHRLRAEILDTVREALAKEGRLGTAEHTLPVLRNLTLTNEQMRSVNSYERGLVLDVFRDTATIGLARGSYHVTDVDPKKRQISVQSGDDRYTFKPEKLNHNATGLSLARFDEIGVRTGDVLHWTANDKTQAISSGDRVTLTDIENGKLTLLDRKGHEISMNADNASAHRLDHALVLNMHKAQGITVENAITVMDSRDPLLNSQSLTYVLASRSREGFELHMDNREAIISQLESNSGIRHSALEIADSAAAVSTIAQNGQPASREASELQNSSDPSPAIPELERTRDFEID